VTGCLLTAVVSTSNRSCGTLLPNAPFTVTTLVTRGGQPLRELAGHIVEFVYQEDRIV